MNKEELKQEAEEYAKKNGSCFSKEYGIRYRTYMDCAEPREKCIAELEKENAELKEKCQNRCDECWEEHIKLTKAKEKISKLLEVIKRPYQFNALRKIQLVNEAVQFLQVLQENE